MSITEHLIASLQRCQKYFSFVLPHLKIELCFDGYVVLRPIFRRVFRIALNVTLRFGGTMVGESLALHHLMACYCLTLTLNY